MLFCNQFQFHDELSNLIREQREEKYRQKMPLSDIGGEILGGMNREYTLTPTRRAVNWRELCPELGKLEKTLESANPISKVAKGLNDNANLLNR